MACSAEVAMIDPNEIAAARRALGRLLAKHRKAAGLNQHQLAPHAHYGRSTIANVETGRQNVPRDFWQRCERALDAGGRLLAAADQLEALVRRQREETAQLADIQGEHRLGRQVAALATPSQVGTLLAHLREQWHLLVKTDNLLGSRHAIRGVLEHLVIVEEMLRITRDGTRREVAQLAAQYAESAAWLHEDAGDPARARYWTTRAMEWAHQAEDPLMLAWALFRRSQQSLTEHDAGQAVGLAQAAHRAGPRLPSPMRAAMFQQEAQGVALDGDEANAQQLIDAAHEWAVPDDSGDARQGHGSFCTPSYLEIQRAKCWLVLGQHRRAIDVYETALADLPTVYHRDRGVALAGLAAAYTADGQPDRAASAAVEALRIARAAGSSRTEGMIASVGRSLVRHRGVPPVAALLHQISAPAQI
jgi:tetratricopeptide (TPR) repeat protein